MQLSSCPLCDHPDINHYYKDTSEHHGSDFYQCQRCRLIFAPPEDRPSPEEEFERYETHENDPGDERYRRFLNQLAEPMNELLEPESEGLDFGSGPGPTLNILFQGQGHRMRIYDPFYANDRSVFENTYDFITATEVVEHLFCPGKELGRLWRCLRPGGYLGIMTEMPRDNRSFFADWHYRLDLTHVTFFTKTTFRWLASHWDALLTFHGNRVIIFR